MEAKNKFIQQEKYLLRAMDEIGQGSKLLWIVFFVCILVSLINGLNSMSYVFIAEIPDYWCSILELNNANWTINQIKNISIINKCRKYDYNYTHLAGLGYEEATNYIKDIKFNTSVISCSSVVFDTSGRSTIVNDWQLVCDRELYRANTFLVYALGKISGTGLLGIFADKYGRKKSLIIGLILQIIASPLSAVVPWFWSYLIFKYITGISVGAMYSSAYTILSEIAKNNKRKLLGAIIDSMYPMGTFTLIILAFSFQNWRHLHLGMSSLALLLVIVIWFVPESPRWLISRGRLDEAQKIIEKYHKLFSISPTLETENLMAALTSLESPIILKTNKGFLHRNFESLKILFLHPDFRKKILIMYFIHYVTTAVSYSLVFSVDNFKLDRYIYMSIVAVNEILAHMTASVLVIFLGSKRANIMLYGLGSVCMLSIIAIPEGNKITIMGVALMSKFCLSATYTVNMLLNSELFPTIARNTALGTSLVLAQVGSLTAPYIVDILGKVVWWAPTTLCSILAFISGLICFMIPQNN
ncbi:organic cation transporter protein-like [Microplitis mediator]|uniref:organic cation transporter protein-like n=1 Tax=Microplitis mediator TaxID=375433 RepID=UPI002556F15D|nr:organic cation transporter protein-like [Microplitis mediator]